MEYQYATYEKRDHVAQVTITRPEVMNALHPPANEELSAIWDDFAADPDAWVAILTGAGDRAFSAGNDLKYTAAHANQMTGPRPPLKGGFGIAMIGLRTAIEEQIPIVTVVFDNAALG